ncbi:MAG: Mu transposase C-terminal domain-containing protein [Syntrophales bacterium]
MTATMEIKPGAKVECSNVLYEITHIIDMESVIVKNPTNGEIKRLFIKDLQLPANKTDEEQPHPDIAAVPDEDWIIAQKRLGHIIPLLNAERRTRSMVSEAAKKAGVDTVTVYRWLKRYNDSKLLLSLLPEEKSGGRGKSRLGKETEKIIEVTIEDYYLSKQKRTVQQTCDEVIQRCKNAGVPLPSSITIRRRISVLSEKERVKRRIGWQAARNKYEIIKGEFPGADYPLSVVQIDHTKLDIILVDDVDRLPIGRPWLTLAIDVYSRMVAGMYVSLDPPGAMSAGLCLSHAILPKEQWLLRYDIKTSWPVCGVMSKIHLDNANEFRGEMLRRSCEQYGIGIDFRPVKTPHFGGHIERLIGTFSKDVHMLPGTTFSNIKERGEYNSDAHAAMTLKEIEQWLATYITEFYHQRMHSELNMSPLKKYEEGIFGKGDKLGCGLPRRIVDEDKLRLDFMPYKERSIQRYGIQLDKVHYYRSVLNRWINTADPEFPKRKKQFLIRRDPRDISVVYFWDPDLKRYFDIPYRDNTRPPISVWELRSILKKLKEEGRKNINEGLIFEAYQRMREIEDRAVKDTKKTRRDKQRRRIHGKAKETWPKQIEEKKAEVTGGTRHEIVPFDEMEEL